MYVVVLQRNSGILYVQVPWPMICSKLLYKMGHDFLDILQSLDLDPVSYDFTTENKELKLNVYSGLVAQVRSKLFYLTF